LGRIIGVEPREEPAGHDRTLRMVANVLKLYPQGKTVVTEIKDAGKE